MQKLKVSLLRFFAEAPDLFPKRGPLLVACSGGPDSVALVHALNAIKNNLPYEFHLVHVNHRLRGRASDGDARFVRNLAQSLGWLYHEKSAPIRIKSGNLEETARVRRYDMFTQVAKKVGAHAVLTAHTQNDQIETILMNLLRGTGSVGLGGMSPVRPWQKSDLLVGRPLLSVSKQEIREALKKGKLSYRSDASNENPKFLRNWLRKLIVPALEKRSPGFQERLGNMASVLRDEEAVWESLLDHMNNRLLRRYRGGHLLDFKGVLSYSPAAQRRFLRRLMGGETLEFEGVERLRRWMASPPSGGRIWQGRLGWVAERLSKSKGAPSTKLFWIRNVNSK